MRVCVCKADMASPPHPHSNSLRHFHSATSTAWHTGMYGVVHSYICHAVIHHSTVTGTSSSSASSSNVYQCWVAMCSDVPMCSNVCQCVALLERCVATLCIHIPVTATPCWTSRIPQRCCSGTLQCDTPTPHAYRSDFGFSKTWTAEANMYTHIGCVRNDCLLCSSHDGATTVRRSTWHQSWSSAKDGVEQGTTAAVLMCTLCSVS